MRYLCPMGKWGRSLTGMVRRITRDRRGATALEFSLVAIPFAALMVAILQTSLTFFAQQTLETTTEKTVRQLVTGKTQRDGLTAAQFKTLVCSKLPVFMKCANLMVDVRQATTFGAVDTSIPTLTYDSKGLITNPWKYEPGGAGSINVVKVMYLWPELAGPLGFNLANARNGKRLLVAASVFKTEPYLT